MIGNAYLYSPTISEEAYKQKFMGNVVKDYFENSYKSLVSFFVEKNKISADELKEIIRLIEEKNNGFTCPYMSPVTEYLLKLSVSTVAVSLFYQFVLRRLTFYNWNRWYFITATMLSFVIPLVDVNRSIPEIPSLKSHELISSIPSIHQMI